MRLMLILTSTVALAACEAPAPAGAPAEPAAAPSPAIEAPPPAEAFTWTTSGDGAALVLTDAGGAPLIRLACRPGSGQLQVVGETLEEIASEDRLTVGVGDEAFAFAADLEAPRTSGVEASGAVPADLLDRLEAGGELGLSYGAQTVGPVPAPTDAAAFIAACRAEL